ncbi:reverse transcriptase domain-containing protein [Seinonella peptonophila]|uniref:reverse transcriptase domain-containing protein n=1 Tax=Seinonella peptonophila TaxID=112248 RepID=UPI000932E209|nr:reverse transcriptase domain-containing protein [Seinonella peptonophila]
MIVFEKRISFSFYKKFFNRVHPDKLMGLVAQKVKDKSILKIIHNYLNDGVIINGVKVRNEEGVTQGVLLSPLLFNIMLEQLDRLLEKRGHKFFRYADDFNIYVKSEKAGNHFMQSMTSFINMTTSTCDKVVMFGLFWYYRKK